MSTRLTLAGIWREMTGADRLVSLLILLLAGGAAAGFRGGDGPAVAVVTVGGVPVAELPLGMPGTFPVAGRIGPVTVTVADGAVRVTEAPCPQRLCVAMGAKSHAGQLIACVPSGVVIRVVGTDGAAGEPDADIPDSISR